MPANYDIPEFNEPYSPPTISDVAAQILAECSDNMDLYYGGELQIPVYSQHFRIQYIPRTEGRQPVLNLKIGQLGARYSSFHVRPDVIERNAGIGGFFDGTKFVPIADEDETVEDIVDAQVVKLRVRSLHNRLRWIKERS